MNWEIFQNSKLVETLGWTLLHSLWQIALVALALFFALKIWRASSANLRYALCIFALALSFVLPFATFVKTSIHLSRPNLPAKNLSSAESAKIPVDLQRAEDFSPTSKIENRQAENPKKSSSLTKAQSYFNENVSQILPFVVAMWFFGVAAFAVRFGGGVWQLRQFKTKGICAPDEDWRERFSALTEKLKITQTVKFLQSTLIETPIVVGWLKPVVLVPTSVFLNIRPEQLEIILAHELVHIRRYDNLVNFVQGLIEILFFYHPGAWWISRIVRREREYACDETVVEIMEGSRLVYAEALANLEEIRLRAKLNVPSEIAVAATGGSLMKRIEKIIKENAEQRRSSSKQSFWSASLALVLISAVVISVFSTQTGFSVNAQAQAADKKLAIGFVSIPPVDRSANPPKDADATARLLIEKLKSHHIPAIGFLTGGSISDGEKFYPVRADIARLWRDAGLEIGIGNFKHVWFYGTPYDEYVTGVEKNEAVAKKLLGEKNLQLRYFSYPYLNTGKNADERNRFEAWLKTQEITPVKYTIDNQEWMYSYAYDMARNDNDVNTMKQIQSEFLSYMMKMFDHYEKYSQTMFGRDIAQTMVLTPSRLVADSSDELFGMIEQRGYKYVSMDEALKDEAYATPENFYGKSGISWFERWQMAKGEKLLDEPRVSQTVLNVWNNRKPDAPPRLIKSSVIPPKVINSSVKN